ncbi:MAG: 3-phosphoshikimate 1-carboxyvinyltransferase [Candidatus Omnitrophica bacterium]|nr:3-phosphoshikimate 1-carboxyvinyltransferase [Candidatus Omnitrophota bacterium]
MPLDEHLSSGAYRIRAAGPLEGVIRVPGDKSISHRAVMLGALADGTTSILGFLEGQDCIATLNAFHQMGIASEKKDRHLIIHGRGLHGLKPPADVIDMGNSGTGTRLLLGILAGQPFSAVLTGDASLRSRPMDRVTQPLRKMGARFTPLQESADLPLKIQGGRLHGIQYQTPVASAQTKSALLLAGLLADGTTEITEPALSRDHTERMLKTFGVTMECDDLKCTIQSGQTLTPREIVIPGDFSSAAFFIVAAAVIPGSDIIIREVGINPTRTGLLDVLRSMGANIVKQNRKYFGAEPAADIHVQYAPLHGTKIKGKTVVRMIDEFPILAVAAACASSPTIVEEAQELRVKESDRISVIVEELRKMGAVLHERRDGFEVEGGATLHGAECFSHGDHRIAMSIAVASLAAGGETVIRGTRPIGTSFPAFFELLNTISHGKAQEIQ